MVFELEPVAVWVVSLVVVASVLWLALHGWRQGRTVREWAAERGLRLRTRGGEPLDGRLAPFRREDEHLVRKLGRVRETVEVGDGLQVFRCEERIDLTPWVSGGGPARTRVAVLFPAAEGDETYTVFDERGRATKDRAPGLRFADPAVSRWIQNRLPDPPHPLSVTLAGGRGLAYLLTASGSVTPDDLDYLVRAARCLAREEPTGETPADGGPAAGERAAGEDRRPGTGVAPPPRRRDEEPTVRTRLPEGVGADGPDGPARPRLLDARRAGPYR